MTFRADWDDDLDQWCVKGSDGGIVARGMPDRLTAEDIAASMEIAAELDHQRTSVLA